MTLPLTSNFFVCPEKSFKIGYYEGKIFKIGYYYGKFSFVQ